MATQPTAPPAIAELPPAPNSSTDTPSEFDTKANNTVAAQVVMVPQINTANDWAEQTAQEVYDNAVEAENSAINSAVSADASQASSLYIGKWEDLTGSASKGESVSYLGAFWRAAVDIPDVTAEQPSSTSLVWVFSSGNTWLKVESSQDSISNAKFQVSATLAPVDIQIQPMVTSETFTLRNNSDSTQEVRLTNGIYTMIGNKGSINQSDNLILQPSVTKIFICRSAGILEIL